MLAWRNHWAENNNFNGVCPELILSTTAHPAFDRACSYYGIKMVKIEADQDTQKVCPKKVRAKVNSNTVGIIASAPQYPHGIYDPVEELAEIAREKGVLLHVDCCLGGFLNPFIEAAGFDIPVFDFRLGDVVTTISADSHKYGCTPKGSSFCMFKNDKFRGYAGYSTMTWPGGAYVSSTLAGARSGVSACITWATLRKIGKSGYVHRTREIMTLAKKLGAAAQKAPGLTVFPTECQTVAFTSKKYNIFKVFEKMNNKGWSLQALQRPPAIHIGVTYFHVDKGDEFVKDFERDLVEICTELMEDSSGEMEKGSKAATLSYFYGMSTAIKGTTAVEKVSKEYINAYYSTK